MPPNKFAYNQGNGKYCVSPYSPRPQTKPTKFDDNNFYNFLVFDTETNSASNKSAEICQLSVIDNTGSHTFSQYILYPQMISIIMFQQ